VIFGPTSGSRPIADDKTSAKRISITCVKPTPVDSASFRATSPDTPANY